MRWKLTIEYDGTAYVGWQRQDNDPSIQSPMSTSRGRWTGAPNAGGMKLVEQKVNTLKRQGVPSVFCWANHPSPGPLQRR